jgi:hypothetical protein
MAMLNSLASCHTSNFSNGNKKPPPFNSSTSQLSTLQPR